MNPFSNIFKHPRTSAAGILISVATVAGVLAQQGVTLGSVGTGGTIVSLAGALATALLGLVARDPGSPAPIVHPIPNAMSPTENCPGNCGCSKSGTTAKLSVWLLIVLLLPLPWLQGCDARRVATDIVNWTPALQSAVATVDSTAVLLAPNDAPLFSSATAGFDEAANVLIAQAHAYLANPSANALVKLQDQVVTFQQQVNAALLTAARIIDPASQQQAITAVQAVAAIITTILALVQSISSKAQIAQMAAKSQIKLAAVSPYLDAARSANLIAAHYNEPVSTARQQIATSHELAVNAGF